MTSIIKSLFTGGPSEHVVAGIPVFIGPGETNASRVDQLLRQVSLVNFECFFHEMGHALAAKSLMKSSKQSVVVFTNIEGGKDSDGAVVGGYYSVNFSEGTWVSDWVTNFVSFAGPAAGMIFYNLLIYSAKKLSCKKNDSFTPLYLARNTVSGLLLGLGATGLCHSNFSLVRTLFVTGSDLRQIAERSNGVIFLPLALTGLVALSVVGIRQALAQIKDLRDSNRISKTFVTGLFLGALAASSGAGKDGLMRDPAKIFACAASGALASDIRDKNFNPNDGSSKFVSKISDLFNYYYYGETLAVKDESQSEERREAKRIRRLKRAERSKAGETLGNRESAGSAQLPVKVETA